ncbi:MAG: 4-hydroxy-3-methylbut-2-enyl diphosphate reductase [Anaplasmataceae bacterium]|nr:4-hydroxy-3-methylbut-2-enyl diphosphate reductase [Anaplasmataceae bacterium]
MLNNQLKIFLANPRGYCAGVNRAITILNKVCEKYNNRKIYSYHQIVHNKYVIDIFEKKGVLFIEDLDLVTPHSVIVFSAHGVSSKVEEIAKKKEDVIVFDATCPLVIKIHKEGQKNEQEGYEVILIGHANHQEVIGIQGRLRKKAILIQSIDDVDNLRLSNDCKLSYITQTTLSINDTKKIVAKLKEKFPNIKGQELKDICYATQNRQNAVIELAKHVELIFVIGSKNSSNSNRLYDLAISEGKIAYLIDSYKEIDTMALKNISSIGITAGASAPDILVQDTITFLESLYETTDIITLNSKKEGAFFKLPTELE